MKVNGKLQYSPMLRVAICLVAGIIAGDMLYGVISPWTWFATAVVCIAAALAAHRHCLLQGFLILLSFALTGGILACQERTETDFKPSEKEVLYHAVITSRPVIGKKTVKFDMTVTDLERPLKVKAFVRRDARAEALCVGAGIECVSRLKAPENFRGADFDYRSWLLRHGYAATTFIYNKNWTGARVSLARLSRLERTELAALRFREKLLERYKNLAKQEDGYAVLAAMTLGDKSALTADLKDDYSVAGASHVLALSGLHLGIIYAVLVFMFSGFRRREVSLAVTVLSVWTYVFIVGMPPSVVRSAVMLTVYTFAAALNRDRMSLNALSFAAAVMLIVNPLCVYDVGFQMSFLAVLSIIIYFPTLCRIMPERWKRIRPAWWLWQLCAVSVAAQIGVAPLVAFYFGRFSCYFLLTNLIAVPLATVILYGAVLMLPSGLMPAAQALLAKGLCAAAELLNSGISFVATLPGASVEGININLIQLFAVYVAIGAGSVFVVYLRKLR